MVPELGEGAQVDRGQQVGPGGQQLPELDEGRAHPAQLVDQMPRVLLGGGSGVEFLALEAEFRDGVRPADRRTSVLQEETAEGRVPTRVPRLERLCHPGGVPVRGDIQS